MDATKKAETAMTYTAESIEGPFPIITCQVGDVKGASVMSDDRFISVSCKNCWNKMALTEQVRQIGAKHETYTTQTIK